MADYPDWVLKHKTKGTYVDYRNGNYYLYAAHSERVKGTKKIKRVYDGYIGKITQEDGLIPAKDKIQTPVKAMEFGLSYFTIVCASDINAGMRRSYKGNGNLYFALSVLMFIYNDMSRELFENSYLSIHYEEISYPDEIDEKVQSATSRGKKMIEDTLQRVLGKEYNRLVSRLRDVVLVSVNDKLYLPEIPESIKIATTMFGIDWSKAKWQK